MPYRYMISTGSDIILSTESEEVHSGQDRAIFAARYLSRDKRSECINIIAVLIVLNKHKVWFMH